MWPEVEKVKSENRHELVLSGDEINTRISKNGFDLSVFQLASLNYLNISQTIFSEVPKDIEHLVNLQTLVLHSNKLENVNENISKLEKLKIVDLSNNAINNIPESFANLSQLVTLNLNFNKLEHFPSSLKKCTKLAVLDVSNNHLKSFPDICSEEMANLAELKLTGNEIEEIPNTINLLLALKLLDLSSNKVKALPGELSACLKLKELNLKANPIADKRLLKLIEQCRTKQILDYVKQHCPKTAPVQDDSKQKPKGRKKKQSGDSEEEDSNTEYKFSIEVESADDEFRVVVMNTVKSVRQFIVCCMVNNVKFTEETFKKFIQLQNKLHETVCEKRNSATLATHDFKKLPPGNLTYTTYAPNELLIKPLNRTNTMTGAELLAKLQIEANNLRKEKKRNTYSGIHKYLYLIEGKSQFPCLLTDNKEVISFPPITNSDISKIDINTTKLFVEVTSTVSLHVCKTVLDTLIKEMVLLLGDLKVQQIKIVDSEVHLKTVYPSKTDLRFDKTVPIRVKMN